MPRKNHRIDAAMQLEASAQYPKEACGVIIKVGKKAILVPCRNMAQDPKNFFLMNVEDYADAADRGEIIAIWHSHPNRTATPSEADLVGVENGGVPWYILGISKDDEGRFAFDGPTVTKPTGFEMAYLGRPYVFGVMDCYTLVRDYYKREFNLHLGEGPRIEFWWRDGKNKDLLKNGAKGQGFIPLIGQEPEVGDLFLISTEGGDANHVALYIGNDTILHHCYGRLSKRDVYAGYWRKHTISHLRLVSKC